MCRVSKAKILHESAALVAGLLDVCAAGLSSSSGVEHRRGGLPFLLRPSRAARSIDIMLRLNGVVPPKSREVTHDALRRAEIEVPSRPWRGVAAANIFFAWARRQQAFASSSIGRMRAVSGRRRVAGWAWESGLPPGEAARSAGGSIFVAGRYRALTDRRLGHAARRAFEQRLGEALLLGLRRDDLKNVDLSSDDEMTSCHLFVRVGIIIAHQETYLRQITGYQRGGEARCCFYRHAIVAGRLFRARATARRAAAAARRASWRRRRRRSPGES